MELGELGTGTHSLEQGAMYPATSTVTLSLNNYRKSGHGLNDTQHSLRYSDTSIMSLTNSIFQSISSSIKKSSKHSGISKIINGLYSPNQERVTSRDT
jgi:hypothetical protein